MPGASASPPASTRCVAAPSSRPLASPLIAAMRPSLTARLPSRAGVPRPSMMRACSITRSWATSAFLLGMRGGGIAATRRRRHSSSTVSVSSGLKVVGGPAAVVRLARAISALMAATRSTTCASLGRAQTSSSMRSALARTSRAGGKTESFSRSRSFLTHHIGSYGSSMPGMGRPLPSSRSNSPSRWAFWICSSTHDSQLRSGGFRSVMACRVR